jgi:hypothetical protein
VIENSLDDLMERKKDGRNIRKNGKSFQLVVPLLVTATPTAILLLRLSMVRLGCFVKEWRPAISALITRLQTFESIFPGTAFARCTSVVARIGIDDDSIYFSVGIEMSIVSFLASWTLNGTPRENSS